MTDEQRELMRIAAQSALARSRNGRDLEPDARRWAQHWASIKPLGRPLGDGAPVPDNELPEPLRGGALEVF
jgi:hypothetical protein